MTANIKSLVFYVIMTPFPFYKNMLNFSGWSCSYKNGALLAKFQPGVLNPFVLICGCLLYSISHREPLRRREVKRARSRYFRYFCLILLIMSSTETSNWQSKSFICKITATQLKMTSQLCLWHFDNNWYKFQKKVGRHFSNLLLKCNPF